MDVLEIKADGTCNVKENKMLNVKDATVSIEPTVSDRIHWIWSMLTQKTIEVSFSNIDIFYEKLNGKQR